MFKRNVQSWRKRWETLHLKSFPLSSDVVDLAYNHLMKWSPLICLYMFCRKDNWRISEMMAIRELVACFIITHHMLQLMEVEVWGPVAKQVVKVVRGEIRRLSYKVMKKKTKVIILSAKKRFEYGKKRMTMLLLTEEASPDFSVLSVGSQHQQRDKPDLSK